MPSVQLKSQKSIGELIHYYRLIKGYSQKDLAKKLHVTISAISSWERGLNKPGLDVAMMIADDIGISLDEFFLFRKPQSIKEPHYLSDRITMSHAYVEISSLSIHQENLSFTLLIKGLSLTLDMVNYYSRQLRVLLDGSPVQVQSVIEQQADEKIMISPELEATMMPVRVFVCRTTLEYEPYRTLEIHLSCQDQEERYVIPASTVRLLHDQVSLGQKTLEQKESLLSSRDHQEVLQFLSKSTALEKLHDYIKRLYL